MKLFDIVFVKFKILIYFNFCFLLTFGSESENKNSNDFITFYVQIENNKVVNDIFDEFTTEIVKKFEVKIKIDQLPKENDGRICVSQIKDLILKDDNFKDVDISEKNILFRINFGCYLINGRFRKERLINKGTANIYFRDKHNYHICCNRYNIKDEIKVNYIDGEKNLKKEDIKWTFEDLNDYYFESCHCCFLTEREIQGIVMKHGLSEKVSIYVHRNNIFIKNKDSYFKEEPIKITEIFQQGKFYREFPMKKMTYYKIKTLYDFLYKVLLNYIEYEDLYSIEYKDGKSGRNNTFNFNNESGQMKKQEDIIEELRRIYVDKNDSFKIKRRKESNFYKYISLKIEIEENKKLLKDYKSGIPNSCKCCLSCCIR